MEKLTTVSPVDNRIYCEREMASEKHITATMSQAVLAQIEWQTTSLEQRANICEKAIQYFETNANQIAEEITWQMGRPIAHAKNEISGLAERARHMISIAAESLAPIVLDKKTGFERTIEREPLGTVLVLAPWNYPYLTAVNTIIPAIMSGNSVILKHSSQTPLCAERFAAAFKHAELLEGIFHYLHLNHKQVSELIAHDAIDYVAFTGSVSGGQGVQRSALNRFIPVGLELGGKDPAYVRSDADLKTSITNLVDGAFYNCGQSCCGIERIYVNESLYDDFVDGFIAEVKQYKIGNPFDESITLGPMVRTSAVQWIKQQTQSAIAEGASACVSNDMFSNVPEIDTFICPQVLTNVNHNMSVMREESFGPIVGIMPVSSDQQAINLMNDSDYGLTASVWSQDVDTVKTISKKIEAGTVFMNRCDYLDPALAWTGVKNTGRGYTLSQLGYHQLTRAKSYHFKLNLKV